MNGKIAVPSFGIWMIAAILIPAMSSAEGPNAGRLWDEGVQRAAVEIPQIVVQAQAVQRSAGVYFTPSAAASSGALVRSCKAYDAGWNEEHKGGHGGPGVTCEQACSQCMKPGGAHGQCGYELTVELHYCVAAMPASTSRTPFVGKIKSDLKSAQESAIESCREAFPTLGSRCYVKYCNGRTKKVASGLCEPY